MSIDDVLRDFAKTGHVLPRNAMQWALDNWSEAAPRFVDLLTRYALANAGERTRQDADALFFAVYLLAEKEEKAAFQPLCRLMLDGEALYDVIGDGVTEGLANLLVNLYDGDLALLKTVIEAESADEYIRNATFNALAYLTFSGVLPRQETKATLRHLHETMQPQGENFAWVGLIDAISALGFDDLRPIAEDILDREFVSPSIMGIEHFDRDLERTLSDPERRACFVAERIGPFGSAIKELSGWYAFSEQDRENAIRESETRNLIAPTDLHTNIITESDIDILDDFLMSDQSPEDCMQLSHLDGFLTGIAAGPAMGQPSEWLPIVWGGEAPQFKNLEQVRQIIGIMLMRYNEIASSLAAGPEHFAPILLTGPTGITIGGDWAEGFLQAIDLHEDLWKPCFADAQARALLAAIQSLCAEPDDEPFASTDPASFRRFQQASAESLPLIVAQINAFWRDRGRVATSQSHQPRSPKVGRNDPCPCGSGKKFKKCCLP